MARCHARKWSGINPFSLQVLQGRCLQMLLTRQEFSVYRQINGTDVFIQKANKLRTGITTLAQREGSGPCLFFLSEAEESVTVKFWWEDVHPHPHFNWCWCNEMWMENVISFFFFLSPSCLLQNLFLFNLPFFFFLVCL